MTEKIVIGNATLYLGDCREILAGMAENSVNWCVTSPPYNLHKEHHTSPNAATAANAAMSAKYAEWYDDDMDEAEYQAEQWPICCAYAQTACSTTTASATHGIPETSQRRSARFTTRCIGFPISRFGAKSFGTDAADQPRPGDSSRGTN